MILLIPKVSFLILPLNMLTPLSVGLLYGYEGGALFGLGAIVPLIANLGAATANGAQSSDLTTLVAQTFTIASPLATTAFGYLPGKLVATSSTRGLLLGLLGSALIAFLGADLILLAGYSASGLASPSTPLYLAEWLVLAGVTAGFGFVLHQTTGRQTSGGPRPKFKEGDWVSLLESERGRSIGAHN